MSLVDAVIIILVLLALFRGTRYGLIQLLLSSVGFLFGLLVGFWVAKAGAQHLRSLTARATLTIGSELVFSLALSTLGEIVGMRLRRVTHSRYGVDKINRVLGSIFEVVFILLAVWLVASGLSNIQSFGLGRSVRDSYVVRTLNRALPNPPDFVAQLEKIISPNGFPKVFVGNEPEHTTVVANPAVDSGVVATAEKSVVKIEGRGCGGVVVGSGFVVASGIIVTNAHVVAGITQPLVVDQSGVHHATTIGFDPDVDVAVLQVKGLRDPTIDLANTHIDAGGSGVVLGFPGGGELISAKATIIDQIRAVGRNIYNQGLVSRPIYELDGDVEPGNSGGPLINDSGQVAGVVFAKSITQPNVGYALVVDDVRPMISQAENNLTPVDVGNCASE